MYLEAAHAFLDFAAGAFDDCETEPFAVEGPGQEAFLGRAMFGVGDKAAQAGLFAPHVEVAAVVGFIADDDGAFEESFRCGAL